MAKEPANTRREPIVEADTSRQSALVGLSPEDTVVGQAMGTPQYMPPEQARGEWEKVDARADVFALGGILCVILTGHPPYTGTHTLAVLHRAEAGDLGECLARLDNCGADTALIELTKWCLAPSACDRPSNGAEIAQQLAAYRFGMEARLVAAESERAAAAGKVEEARLWAATEYMAKLAAEERAAEAELYADTMTAITRVQNRRRRGVFAAVVLMLLILSGVYGNFREQKSLAPRPSPALPRPHRAKAKQSDTPRNTTGATRNRVDCFL